MVVRGLGAKRWPNVAKPGPHAELCAEGNATAGPLPRLMLSYAQGYAEHWLKVF